MAIETLLPAFAVVFVGYSAYSRLFSKRSTQKRLPGPEPLPLIGNLLDLPQKGTTEFTHWLTHKDKYGPISSVSIFGQTMLVLHDREAASDLLEKRSKVTSGRPYFEFSHLAGYGGYITVNSYTDMFRKQRKFVHQQLGTKRAADQYSHAQRYAVKGLLTHLLENPDNLVEHFKVLSGTIILQTAYGYSVDEVDEDPMIRLVERMMMNFAQAFMPMAWIVDALPFLKSFPEWLPGMSFQRIGREWTRINEMVANIPYTFTRQQMAAHSHRPSLVSKMVEDVGHGASDPTLDPDDEYAIKWSVAALYGGGADTTVSSLTSFILAMVMCPEIQRRAQEELDNVVGSLTLPQPEDRDRLPYINALVKETLRWFPVVPLGVVHETDAEIEYRGYTIPKGAMIIPSIWWFLHDPEIYDNPDTFDPTRFLPPRNQIDPANYAFGFGRRICPGRFLADGTIFLSIAQMLAVFNITKAVDEKGVPIEPVIKHISGLLDRPQDFPYTITPRSKAHQELIEKIAKENPRGHGDSHQLGDAPVEIDDILAHGLR
ncbi:cytochrome P450 oxidoreductase OrdA-like protein [Stachybotrys elegans]|uniref:Cytochrome P450 oxidoreductase OrdA-like protein n=1 Tax=Stachybotrys elegans TaxID=80388 RepID=A0A8K0SPI7_9HYPO|nr:cytochrome P450 oxidoreductase OrdA-like protein [Stachybotrys elegans]